MIPIPVRALDYVFEDDGTQQSVERIAKFRVLLSLLCLQVYPEGSSSFSDFALFYSAKLVAGSPLL